MMGQVRETLPVCEKANNKYKSDLPIFRSVVTIELQKCTVQDNIFNCTKSVGQNVCSVRFVTSNSALLQWQESIKIAAENRQQKYVSGGILQRSPVLPILENLLHHHQHYLLHFGTPPAYS